MKAVEIFLGPEIRCITIDKQAGKEPVVVDGNTIRANPEAIVAKLCTRLNLPFSEKMLQWPAGPKPEDGIWAKYWYENVHNSTGFSPPDEKRIELTEHLLPVYEEALPHYQFLSRHILSV